MIPVMRAVDKLTAVAVATAVLLLAHDPASVVSTGNMDCPWHTAEGPSMGDTGLTIIEDTMPQPLGSEYEISTVPDDVPVTIPVPAPMEAMVVLALLHAPPGVALLNNA